MKPLIGLMLLAGALALWTIHRLPIAADHYTALLAGLSPLPPGGDPGEPRPDSSDMPAAKPVRSSPGTEDGRAAPLLLAAFTPQVSSPAEDGTEPPGRVVEPAAREQSVAVSGSFGVELAGANAPNTEAPDAGPLAAGAAIAASKEQEIAFSLAGAAYDALRSGDRRAAADGLFRAIAAAPAHAGSDGWRRDLAALKRRLFVSAYASIRDGRGGPITGPLPAFGGSQQAAAVRYILNPLSAAPVGLAARVVRAPQGGSRDTATEGVIGAHWQPLGRSGPTIAAEHRFDLGGGFGDADQLRIAGGYDMPGAGFAINGYADAGAVLRGGDLGYFASAQGFGGIRPAPTFSIGGGTWAGWQHLRGRDDLFVEAGPAMAISIPLSGVTLRVEGSYRVRVIGSAGPPRGPALTLSAAY